VINKKQEVNSVLIVDDHILFREGLRNIICHWRDFEVMGEASNGEEALQIARDSLPDVVLMDIAMPVMNGILATRKITRELPSIKVVMLTMSEEETDLFEALKSGAHGYILKDTPSRRLRDQLIKLLEGETPFSGVIATKILREFNQPGDASSSKNKSSLEPLTDREQQVLELVVEGLGNPEIARRLYLSENTIKKYLRNILDKLHLNNRVEAAIYAIREGLVKQ
jgi:DNA-binding NarL/FixJ family response regulator